MLVVLEGDIHRVQSSIKISNLHTVETMSSLLCRKEHTGMITSKWSTLLMSHFISVKKKRIVCTGVHLTTGVSFLGRRCDFTLPWETAQDGLGTDVETDSRERANEHAFNIPGRPGPCPSWTIRRIYLIDLMRLCFAQQ